MPTESYIKKDDESWEKCLQRLYKNKVTQPALKREYDIKRQRVMREEKAIRHKITQIDKQIKEKKAQHEALEAAYNNCKNDAVFKQFRNQLDQVQSANEKLQSHQQAQKAMKDKSIQLRRTLGQFKSLKALEEAIEKDQQKITSRQYKSIREENIAVAKIQALKKKRAMVKSYEDTQAEIEAANEDPEYKANKAEQQAQHNQLQDVKNMKQAKEQEKSVARKNMNQAWEELTGLWTTKREHVAKARQLTDDAKKVSKDYRDAEKKYLDYMKDVQKAEGKAAQEKRDAQRKARQDADREAEQAAMEDVGAGAGPSLTPPNGRARGPKKSSPKDTEADKPKPKEKPDKPKPPRKKKAKQPEEKKEDESSTMAEIYVPFHEKIEQFEALQGYLQTLMPRQPKPDSEGKVRGGKRRNRKRKAKGSLKHYLNWVTAFSNAGVSSLLPNKREDVERCFTEISAKLEEYKKNSQTEIDKSKTKAAQQEKEQEAQAQVQEEAAPKTASAAEPDASAVEVEG